MNAKPYTTASFLAGITLTVLFATSLGASAVTHDEISSIDASDWNRIEFETQDDEQREFEFAAFMDCECDGKDLWTVRYQADGTITSETKVKSFSSNDACEEYVAKLGCYIDM
jgi:hypothetical protein